MMRSVSPLEPAAATTTTMRQQRQTPTTPMRGAVGGSASPSARRRPTTTTTTGTSIDPLSIAVDNDEDARSFIAPTSATATAGTVWVAHATTAGDYAEATDPALPTTFDSFGGPKSVDSLLGDLLNNVRNKKIKSLPPRIGLKKGDIQKAQSPSLRGLQLISREDVKKLGTLKEIQHGMKFDQSRSEWEGNEDDLEQFPQDLRSIRPLGPQTVPPNKNGMQYDPVNKVWNGNQDMLATFEKKQLGVIGPLTVSSVHFKFVPPQAATTGMKYDEEKKMWIGNAEEDDVFADIDTAFLSEPVKENELPDFSLSQDQINLFRRCEIVNEEDMRGWIVLSGQLVPHTQAQLSSLSVLREFAWIKVIETHKRKMRVAQGLPADPESEVVEERILDAPVEDDYSNDFEVPDSVLKLQPTSRGENPNVEALYSVPEVVSRVTKLPHKLSSVPPVASSTFTSTKPESLEEVTGLVVNDNFNPIPLQKENSHPDTIDVSEVDPKEDDTIDDESVGLEVSSSTHLEAPVVNTLNKLAVSDEVNFGVDPPRLANFTEMKPASSRHPPSNLVLIKPPPIASDNEEDWLGLELPENDKMTMVGSSAPSRKLHDASSHRTASSVSSSPSPRQVCPTDTEESWETSFDHVPAVLQVSSRVDDSDTSGLDIPPVLMLRHPVRPAATCITGTTTSAVAVHS
ncbi:hypothetical protein Pelo_16737 [Pelomyxa schiedti]|nr:hypothetical protein Pelo_16737 [Pelomyxa schiedti]